MPVYRIPKHEHAFPHPELAEPDGLLGVGGDLAPARLLLAYANGIFPWYSEGQPILWFSPDPRFVLFPDRFRVPRSLKKIVRRGDFEIRLDTAFTDVIAECRKAWRPGQAGTWITQDMLDAYSTLHTLGFAHSCEAWQDGELVGGLYGVAIGDLFAGESMFAKRPDASKVAFVWLVEQLRTWGYRLIDSQVHTAHLERFGAEHISRRRYLTLVHELVKADRAVGPWQFDAGFSPGV
ncbi:MAG: leucyl/phenylalanyl-tRNA--protein transferase [Alphaproteobacteria bacterium]|nr:leucyl/phenylalanyl-tRNA--protein transferase [Alphaproteobacteria bacterium]